MERSYERLAVSRSGDVLEVILDRPDLHNAIDHVAHDEIEKVFDEARRMPGLRAILFGARGESFCAGGDFDLILADREDRGRRQELMDGARALFTAVADCPIPIVVAIQGDVVGLGTTLALGCDAIVATRKARISDPHVVIGLAAGDGGCIVWPQSVGLLLAKRYLLTGDRLTAEDAYRIGLVTDMVDTPEEALPVARAIAERIAALPPLAVQQTKRILNQALRHRTEELFEMSIAGEMATFYSEDAAEAIGAIRNRRRGVYRGV